MKQKIYVGVAVLAIVMFVTGAGVLAVASPGTSVDPLITLSYLNGPFRTAMDAHVAAQAAALTSTFNSRAAQIETQVRTAIAANTAATFTLHTLNNGQSFSLPEGAEVMLRSGSATIGTGSLVNQTAGTEQTSGAMVLNNMYFAASTGRITATANATTIFVRG